MNKILNNKIILFLILFIIISLATSYMLIPSYNLDGFCEIMYGYKEYADNFFLEAGRFLTFLIFRIISITNISHDSLSVISVILTNLILSGTILLTMSIFDKEKNRLLVLLGSFILIFSPFIQEIYIYEESFCIALSIFLTILSAKLFIDKKNILSLILLLSASFLYQGNLCFFIPVVLTYLFVNKKEKSIKAFIKNNYKDIIKCLVIYVLTLAISYIALKLFVNITNMDSRHITKINIFQNIFGAFTYLLFTIKTHFNIENVYIYYAYMLFLLFYLFRKNKYYFKASILIIILSYLITLVPVLAMSSNLLYFFPRMCLIVDGSLGLLLIIVSKTLYNQKYIVLVSSIYILITVITIFINCNMFYNNYKKELSIVNHIENKIEAYEKETNIEVNKIYTYNPSVNFYTKILSNRHYNENNLFSCDLTGLCFECSINIKNNKYKVTGINSTKLFEEKNKYMFFIDDTLYIYLSYEEIVKDMK